MELNRGVSALFIVVAVVLVLVEGKIAIRSAIDAQFYGVLRLLRGPFLCRSHRNDRSRAYKQRELLYRRSGINRARAFYRSSGPKVVPFRLWQVNTSGIGARFSNGIHEEGWAEHELVSDARGARIGAEIHHQSAHGRVALARGHPCHGIDVRQQPVAKRVIA